MYCFLVEQTLIFWIYQWRCNTCQWNNFSIFWPFGPFPCTTPPTPTGMLTSLFGRINNRRYCCRPYHRNLVCYLNRYHEQCYQSSTWNCFGWRCCILCREYCWWLFEWALAVTITLVLGILILPRMELAVYPNPVTGRLTIVAEESIISRLGYTTFLGNLVLENKAAASTYQWTLSGLSNGVYLLQLQKRNKSWQVNWLKNRKKSF